MRSAEIWVLSIAFLLGGRALSAQTSGLGLTGRNEVGLQIGATVTPGVTLEGGRQLNFNPGFTLGAEYDYRFIAHRVGIAAGVDFLASPFDVQASNATPNISPQYAFLFLTPNMRVSLHPGAAVSPWLLFGGGYADFAPAAPSSAPASSSGGGSTGALEFGGGVDTKPLLTLPRLPVLGSLPVATRFEVRDFYSGEPNYRVPSTSSFQNNIAFTGGLLLRF